MPTETSAEAPKTSPEAPRDVIQQVNGFLERLKTDVAKEANPDKKKEIVAKSYKSLNQSEREELSKRVEEHKEGIPHELLEDLIGVLDVTDERKAALKAAIESGSDKKKPEGWMAWAGDQMKSGADKVTGWMKQFGSWTSNNAGKGWQHFVEGATATIAAIGSGWAWLREKAAHALGSLTASVDDYLPDWIKKPLNFLMGDYGVIYKNFSKRRIEIVSNGPNQELSLEPLMEKFRSLSDNGKGGSFDDFCNAVALKARNNRAGPLKVKQSELEQAADLVVAEMLKKPAVAPAPAPGVAPAVAPVAAVAGAAAVAAVAPEVQKPNLFPEMKEGVDYINQALTVSFEGTPVAVLISPTGEISVNGVRYRLKRVLDLADRVLLGASQISAGTCEETEVQPQLTKALWSQKGLLLSGSIMFTVKPWLRDEIAGTHTFTDSVVAVPHLSTVLRELKSGKQSVTIEKFKFEKIS